LDWNDSHDKLAKKILADLDDPENMRRYLSGNDHTLAPLVTNLNLVGIRRRLNAIQVGVWVIVALLVVYMITHW